MGSSAINKKPFDQSSSRLAKLVNSAEDNCIDRSTRSIRINEGILARKRKSVQPCDTGLDIAMFDKIQNEEENNKFNHAMNGFI